VTGPADDQLFAGDVPLLASDRVACGI